MLLCFAAGRYRDVQQHQQRMVSALCSAVLTAGLLTHFGMVRILMLQCLLARSPCRHKHTVTVHASLSLNRHLASPSLPSLLPPPPTMRCMHPCPVLPWRFEAFRIENSEQTCCFTLTPTPTPTPRLRWRLDVQHCSTVL